MATEACVITFDEESLSAPLHSDELRALLETEAARVAKEKHGGAAAHLHGYMPDSGLYQYRVRHTKRGWRAYVIPINRAAYAIGKKYGVKNL